MSSKSALSDVATKADLAHLERVTKTDLAAIRAEMATKTDLAVLRAPLEIKMAEHKVEVIRWVLGISIAQAATILAC